MKRVILDGTLIISEESTVKSLSVTLDCKLNWKEHVFSLCKKLNSLTYRLNLYRKFTKFKLYKHLVVSLLFPLVDLYDLSDKIDLEIQ